MFYYIKGTLAEIEENAAIVENSGIAYKISVSSNTLVKIADSKQVQLYTYMHLREDAVTLYGFYSLEEKRMFENLITVSGVGCKVALAVLSGMSLKDLAVSIANADTVMLSRIKGIGKKTAERIVLELKEKVDSQGSEISFSQTETVGGIEQDAYSALLALGLKKGECAAAVKKAVADGAQTAQQIISIVLKKI
ncbi:MAG: Holliday junction branch migration protein RuvA [Clostridia bacterium]|nr:Holliday junction branch migration protein RuvA [Clostridia bacterium]